MVGVLCVGHAVGSCKLCMMSSISSVIPRMSAAVCRCLDCTSSVLAYSSIALADLSSAMAARVEPFMFGRRVFC